MLENAFAGGTGFSGTDRPGNGLVKHLDFAAVSTPNQIVDLLSVVGAAVGHGQQDALNFQFGVDLPSDLLHGLQKLFPDPLQTDTAPALESGWCPLLPRH